MSMFRWIASSAILLVFFGRGDGQLIMQPAIQSVRNYLLPQEDNLSNRIISFMADRIFEQDVVPNLNNVRFYLWTRYNPNGGMRLLPNRPDMLIESLYDRQKPLKILIHGFGGNGTKADRFASRAVDAYLMVSDVNVLTVDWSLLAAVPNYARAALSTTPVGVYVAQFLDFLIAHGTPPSAIHIIGYSLGAHVAGSAGRHVRLGKVGRITGLEPASGGFERPEKLRSLERDDAVFVDVIHTNANILGLGIIDPIGHADFYPNGGHWQFGCIWNEDKDSIIHCSHGRSTQYFVESILGGPGKFLASRCSSYWKFNLGACQDCRDPAERCVSMGEHAIYPRASGVYFLKTNPTPPFSLE